MWDAGFSCRRPTFCAFKRNRRDSMSLSPTLTMFVPPNGKLYLKMQLALLGNLSFPHFCGIEKAESILFQREEQDHGKSPKDVHPGVQARGSAAGPNQWQVDRSMSVRLLLNKRCVNPKVSGFHKNGCISQKTILWNGGLPV
jgi:hypothetical protein